MLLCYATHDGQSRRIAERIADRLAARGIPVGPRDLGVALPGIEELGGCGVVVVVAAVRYIGLELRFRREGCGAPGHGLPLAVLFTLLVALIGFAIALFLATVRY